MKSKLRFLSPAVVIALSFGLYVPVLKHGFYWDDFRILNRIELVARY